MAGNFDDSSCKSSEEYGGGKHKHRHHKHRPKPPRPPPRPPARPKCEQGWYTSYRPQGIWCLRIFYIAINIILFASAALYIPIFISIRKLGALPSIIEFKPHKYVLYQTMAVVSSKIVRFHGYSL
ncbi:hypothetical protein GCK72_012545 [Caenorhabditis remanei]|uniref:Uncharacterized protein n=1 Tax=Caenorhabditis remanei TaxID=31234 RepID=A0A6A5GNQ1_CAERE|nr:hypothetical protein GCK72_012544 [Caenorhabditis remanei]XP_053583975.1 hypothetical protein GCK72_012545 [Caenorhabditis remanei]KAF1756091.1 hypothetical protein GCK72_012544 [Caenorhabditis remanei]KAF1756092.1 hypothetical protein GCK72_012545 [Caenorhabditis remanei]